MLEPQLTRHLLQLWRRWQVSFHDRHLDHVHVTLISRNFTLRHITDHKRVERAASAVQLRVKLDAFSALLVIAAQRRRLQFTKLVTLL